MQFRKNLVVKHFVTLVLIISFAEASFGQAFTHPGINQNIQDLAFMKKMIQLEKQPYQAAFLRLKASADTNFVVKAHTHVLRGPYGKPDIGGGDLRNGANMAYDCAVMWYLTYDQKYADKAIEIINAWSPTLWDFDYNDAKLLAAWTGHLLCNAGEILRYTKSGWQQKDINSFSKMLMTVYYPLMRYYFPQANGNWNGAIIHSLMAMAIFTDNRKMFNDAVDNFLHAPANGSLFKYIYPNGQCQESPRDQAHVQLGLGEFAGAAQIAYTQGVDLLSIAENRLALGYEYTAKFLLGEKPHCYCTISERAKALRDDYEYIYRHYTAKGVDVPWTKLGADSVRNKASRSILTSMRASFAASALQVGPPTPSKIGYIAGATSSTVVPENAIFVSPGESIQKFPETLKIPSKITLAGEGLATVLFLDPASGQRDAMLNAAADMSDVTIRDLVIEASNKTEIGSDPNTNRSNKGGYNRGGIVFRALKEGQMKNINLVNISVKNATFQGVLISGADGVNITRCDFNENGGNVVPGPALQHNLSITHSSNIIVTQSRLSTSPFGSGISFDHCKNAKVNDCEISRNAWHGILVAESSDISISKNLIEANDKSGVMLEFLFNGNSNINISNNIIHYNTGKGIESFSTTNGVFMGNKLVGNGL
jgi:parallel beta-helix repeat protein